MPVDDSAALATLLPGKWVVKATNFPMWLGGRRDATFEYGLLRDRPLTLSDRVAFIDLDDKPNVVVGTDTWNGHGFTWRKRGLAGLFVKIRWEVASIHQGLAIMRFEKSITAPSGVDVMVAEGRDASAVRTTVAADPRAFGLSIEEFASLTWLEPTA